MADLNGDLEEVDARPDLCRYHARVTNYLRKLCNRNQEVADLVQEAYLRALVALRRGSRPHDPEGWLLTIARNVARDDAKRWRTHAPGEFEDSLDALCERTSIAPVECAAKAEAYSTLRRLVHALPEHQRTLLVAYYGSGRSCKSIARELGITYKTVKTRLYRARNKLRRNLWEVMKDGYET